MRKQVTVVTCDICEKEIEAGEIRWFEYGNEVGTLGTVEDVCPDCFNKFLEFVRGKQ